MIRDLVMLYLGGSLAIALACLAMFRQPVVGEAARQHGKVRSMREALLFPALWPPALAVFVAAPSTLNRKK